MNRRNFITGAAVVSLGTSACRRESSSYRVLSNAEAETLRALCGQIIPSDDVPGADQAGAVQFIDIQLTRHYRRHRRRYQEGLKAAEAIATSKFARPLAQLSLPDQLRCAEELERTDREFFAMLVAHTMQAYYGSPRHGGNLDAVSWRMLGMSPVQARGRNS